MPNSVETWEKQPYKRLARGLRWLSAPNPIWGLIRTDVLRRTKLTGTVSYTVFLVSGGNAASPGTRRGRRGRSSPRLLAPVRPAPREAGNATMAGSAERLSTLPRLEAPNLAA